MLLGLGIYNSVNLDLPFPKVVFKKLANEPIIIEDLEEFEPEIYKGLRHIEQYTGNLEEDLGVTFQVQYEHLGATFYHQLKPEGDKLYVNQENKMEYIELYVDWLLNKSIESQFRSFYKGFYKVVTGEMIKVN